MYKISKADRLLFFLYLVAPCSQKTYGDKINLLELILDSNFHFSFLKSTFIAIHEITDARSTKQESDFSKMIDILFISVWRSYFYPGTLHDHLRQLDIIIRREDGVEVAELEAQPAFSKFEGHIDLLSQVFISLKHHIYHTTQYRPTSERYQNIITDFFQEFVRFF